MRYVVRSNTPNMRWRYLGRDANSLHGWWQEQRNANRFDKATARDKAKKHHGRVVRLVSRAEAVAKARAEGRAEGLREAAKVVSDYAEAADVPASEATDEDQRGLVRGEAACRRHIAATPEQMAADGVGR
jgi:hypothetical protein